MAEAMTAETILEADWQLRGFWTRLRFPLRTHKGGWSDIDLLAYNPETRHLVVSESKVRGPKRDVFAYTPKSKERYGDILEYDDNIYFAFLRHIELVCKDGTIFGNFRKMVRTLTIQLVSNYYIDPAVEAEAAATVQKKIAKKVPSGIKVQIALETTLDVILRILTTEGAGTQGRRYGHPIIDLARELNRYMHPNVRYAGHGNGATRQIKEALGKKILKAFGRELNDDLLPNKRLQLTRGQRAARS